MFYHRLSSALYVTKTQTAKRYETFSYYVQAIVRSESMKVSRARKPYSDLRYLEHFEKTVRKINSPNFSVVLIFSSSFQEKSRTSKLVKKNKKIRVLVVSLFSRFVITDGLGVVKLFETVAKNDLLSAFPLRTEKLQSGWHSRSSSPFLSRLNGNNK